MRILLIQTMEYLYSIGGAHKANRMLMEGLAQKGHICRVISPIAGSIEYFFERLSQNNLENTLKEVNDKCIYFNKNGVDVFTITKEFYLFSFIKENSKEFEPDITLISEDHTGLLMEIAFETASKIIYISHTQATLPFGPAFFGENPTQLRLYKKLHGIISVSRFVKNYILEWADLDSEVIYFPSYGKDPFPLLGKYDNKYVTIINPSGIKGIDIFMKIAQSLPHVSFAAIPTWSTTEVELERMKSMSNISILKPEEDIDIIYYQTKVLLVPSLWGEAFGQVVVEAMLRGIPVIASNVGGLPEAKMGLDYIIPVKPIEKYLPDQFSIAFPSPVIPDQDVNSWIQALNLLLNDKDHYIALSQKSHEKALIFVKNIGIEYFEMYFKKIIEMKDLERPLGDKYTIIENDKKVNVIQQIGKLSPQKREKLLFAMKSKRLRKTTKGAN